MFSFSGAKKGQIFAGLLIRISMDPHYFWKLDPKPDTVPVCTKVMRIRNPVFWFNT
jgi:hypothetical protein